MSFREGLLRVYFKQTSKPTFNNFAFKKSKFIENISILMDASSPLSLQQQWITSYNAVIQVERPNLPLCKKPLKASQRFMQIFNVVEVKKRIDHNLRVANLNTTSEAIESVVQRQEMEALNQTGNLYDIQGEDQDDIQGEDQDDIQGEDQDDIQGEDQENVQVEDLENHPNEDQENVRDENRENLHRSSLSLCMNEKAKDLNNDLIKKLVLSSCINLTNIEDRETFSAIIPQPIYHALVEESSKKKQEFDSALSKPITLMINSLFDKLKVFQFEKEIQNIISFIDNEKAKLKDKTSDEYNLLCMIDIVIKNFTAYKREANLSESSHLRIFEKVLDPLLVKTEIISKDGETVCRSTKRMQILNEADAVFGKRIDLLLSSDSDDQEDIDLCSLEFKKTNETEAVLKYQQNKNIRINSCILNDISLLVGDTLLPTVYLDFSGRSAYIVQLYRHEDCFVAHIVGKFIMMKSLLELENFRNHVISLYTWRQYIININNNVSLARINQVNKYSLVDVSDADIGPSSSPKRNVEPIKIFLSPSKGAKRTRSVFEEDE